MNRIILLTSIWLFSLDFIHAQWRFAEPLDLSAVPQIIRPNDAQGVAMGLTGVAYREGLFAGYTNPAGLIFDHYSVGFSHIPGIQKNDENIYIQDAIGLGIPLKNGFAVYAQFCRLGFGETTVYPDQGERRETKKSGMAEFQLSVTKNYSLPTFQFSLGATAKYFKDYYLPDMKSDAFLFDMGFRFKRMGQKWYSFGAALHNDGQDLEFYGYDLKRVVQMIRVGLAFGNEEFSSMKNVGFLSTIEYQKSVFSKNDKWNQLGGGLEICYFKYIFTRLGYSFDRVYSGKRESVEGYTYGLGVRTPEPVHLIIPVYLSFEYARGLADYRDFDKNIVSVSVEFVN